MGHKCDFHAGYNGMFFIIRRCQMRGRKHPKTLCPLSTWHLPVDLPLDKSHGHWNGGEMGTSIGISHGGFSNDSSELSHWKPLWALPIVNSPKNTLFKVKKMKQMSRFSWWNPSSTPVLEQDSYRVQTNLKSYGFGYFCCFPWFSKEMSEMWTSVAWFSYSQWRFQPLLSCHYIPLHPPVSCLFHLPRRKIGNIWKYPYLHIPLNGQCRCLNRHNLPLKTAISIHGLLSCLSVTSV